MSGVVFGDQDRLDRRCISLLTKCGRHGKVQTMKIEFQIEWGSDHAAGLRAGSDTVRIEVEPGPDGDHEQERMVEMFREALAAWYDDAKVMTKAEYDAIIDQMARHDEAMEQSRRELGIED